MFISNRYRPKVPLAPQQQQPPPPTAQLQLPSTKSEEQIEAEYSKTSLQFIQIFSKKQCNSVQVDPVTGVVTTTRDTMDSRSKYCENL